jgi:nicotinic acid mononucleotide adenylyltransferase
MDWFDCEAGARQALSHPITEAIKGRMLAELTDMAAVINIPLAASPFKEIWAEAEFSLDQITSHLSSRKLFPASIADSAEEGERTGFGRAARIGFYPVCADPFHWGHLLVGLSAIARFKLDKVIYIIACHDARKPEMTPPAARHAMGRSILSMFTPLFDYSDAAMEGDLDGESSLFKVLASLPAQRINAFYIAGSDHCRRMDPETGATDTVQKLLRTRAWGFDSERHRVSMIFVRRGKAESSAKTRLGVSHMPGMPFEASSTIVRRALSSKEGIDRLALLPYTAYLYIQALELYTRKPRIERREGSLAVERVA